MRTVLFTVGIALLFGSMLNAGLVTNGTFSLACVGLTAPNWTAANTDSFGGCRDTGGNPAGSFILNGTGSAATDPSISQVLAGLIVGQVYVITLDYKTEWCGSNLAPTCTGVTLTNAAGVSIDNQLFQITLSPDTTWRTFTTNFTYSGGPTTLIVTGERNGTDAAPRVDNIDVNLASAPPTGAIPEPGTFALMLGAAGLVLAKRRWFR